ncbi:MoaD/ThiS family protein [Fusibacter bizertensis]
MIITVKLFATLRNYNEKIMTIEVLENITVKEVALQVKLPIEEIAIIMINGRSCKLDATLKENDTLAFFPAVGGG